MRRVLGWLRRPVLEIARRGQPRYLTRWTLAPRRWLAGFAAVMLHLFHRGDLEPYDHDHPWGFVTVILAGGYWEVTERGRVWYGPGSVLFRPARWRHRVSLPEGKTCWTLVVAFRKVRRWGFVCPGRGWIHWREHEANEAAGLTGCGEEGGPALGAAAHLLERGPGGAQA
ncbi:MAG TPA: hypothetical protein VJ739_03225 [Gemmataceae bacterium]|nr:hypothetical protein [Gemmataceae bacterium]